MALLPALAIAGVMGLDAFGKSNAQKKALKQQSKIALQNASIEEQQSRNALDYGRNQVEDYQRGVGAFKSSQINALAENGIDVSQGSAIDILASTEMQAQADIDTLRYNAAMQSWGHKAQQTNYINQSRGLSAQASSINPAFEGLLSGATGFLMAGGAKGLNLGGGK